MAGSLWGRRYGYGLHCWPEQRRAAAAAARWSPTTSATSPTSTPATSRSCWPPPLRRPTSSATATAWAGTTCPWYTTQDDFSKDFGVDEYFGFNVFIRHDGDVYRTYFTNGRAAELIGNVWSLLDLTPLGRQEEWEDSPEGYPQEPPYLWWRRHDEYGTPVDAG